MTSGTQKHSSRATTKTQCVFSPPAARAWTVTGRGAVSVDCGVFTVPPAIGCRPTPPNWRVLRTASATSRSFCLVVVTRFGSRLSQADVEDLSDDFNVTLY